MHLIESTKTSATSGSCPEPPPAEGQQQHHLLPRVSSTGGNNKSSRPWDYDTEDSGVDSVSSLAGLETENSGNTTTTTVSNDVNSVEYSAVIVNNNKVNNCAAQSVVKQPVQQRKSFLHTVYGGVQQSQQQQQQHRSPPSMLDANKNLFRKNVTNKVISKRGGGHGVNQQSVEHDNRALESAKNHFLHSLLDDEVTKASVRSTECAETEMESSASSTSMALDLLPELVHLLDANRVMDGGLIELIGRDGTRASLRVTLAPSSSSSQSATSAAVMTSRKNSFNTRLHRNSKRSSQRRCHKPEIVAEATTSTTTTAATKNTNKTAASSSVSAPSLANNLSGGGGSSGNAGFITAQRPRSVRRRPSLSSSFHKKVVPGFSVSMAIPPSKVAILASKFNSLINESRRNGNSATNATTNNNNNNNNATGPDADDKKLSGTTTTSNSPLESNGSPPISSTWSWRLVGPATTESLVPINKRNNLASSVGRSRPIDTIPEIIDPPPPEETTTTTKSNHIDYSKPRRKSHDLSQPYGGRIHPVARPLPSDPAGSLKNRESVYGTVMSIVKQAIRKFEKLEDGKVAVASESNHDNPSISTPSVDGATSSCYYQEPAAVIPEGIEPNNSFLWRDQKSMQNLIYEATSFSERTATSITATGRSHPDSCNYYEMGSSKYDTLRSRRSNAYDTLHHRNQSKSSSSSSSGYDEIRSPESLTSNPSDPATSVKYDDIKLTPNCVTYDELSYLTGRRQSNGYDELMRSPLSTTSSGGYIDPGSSSALGYERILPPEDQRGNPTAEQTEDEDGSTLRYEECGSPSGAIPSCSSPITVTALPAIVCEDQLDSISYLYDDIRTVGLGRNGGGGYGGCYSGSNHSYEPIYAHLGEVTSKMESSNSTSSLSSTSGHNDKCSDSTLSDSSEEGVHEVCSYKLTQLGNGAVPDSPAPSLAGTSTSTRTGAERRSETSDEWIDISDPDEPAWTVTRIRQRHEVTNASFVRRGHRASRRKLSIPKASGQQSWSQTMRTLVKNGFNKATTLSKRSGKDIQRQQQQQQAIKSTNPLAASSRTIYAETGGPSVVQLTKSSARRLPSAETEASGTGSSQTWEDYGESDGDDLADDHHYEALYEVINPRLPSAGAAAASVTLLDHNDDSFDDSFDSDDAFEEVVVRGLDAISDTSRERPGSRSGSERSKESEDPSQRSSQVKIGRFADLAGEQMRRLRRNWTTTKTDIGKSITRIKKKSTASVADLSEVFKPSASRREVSPEKSNGAANKETSSPSSPTAEEIRPNNVEQHKKKGTWAMRQIRRRMTVVSSPNYGLANKEKASTFYLTLTIEKPTTTSAVKTNGKSPAVSETSSPEPVSTPSPVPPLISPTDSSKVPVRPKRISSAYPIGSQYQSTVRPKTAPPAPPVKSNSQQQAAAESAMASSPPPLASVPAKKPLSRLPTAFSESRIAAERSLLMDEYQSMHYSDISFVTPGQKQNGPPPSSLSTPYSRLSMASVTSSRHSSETYMGVGDLASAPERSLQDEVRNYLDLQSPIESEELYISSHFADEPLYQFYTAAIIERATQNQGDGSEEDDYEVIGEHRRKEEEEFQDPKGNNAKLPTAMELVMPSSGRRTLWCELPQVINSGLFETISPQQRKLQEAKFELITSEASYLRSLNVLTTHFIQSREFAGDSNSEALLSRLERHTLFSDIVPVRECSEALLADLEQRWQENVFIREICDILLEHASKHFEVYIKYCTNQLYQERMLRDLKDNKPQFVDCLRRLESSPVCQSLAMHSFLMLPMQRITRLPLLVDAIFHRLESGTPEFERCRMTLATLNKIVQECNEGARKAERIHEMLVVSNQLDFADVKAISVMSASRWLVKKGEMQRLMWRDIDARLTFGRKIHKQTVYVFLFTDLLVITKKKGEDSYAVLDYCPRNMVQVDEHIRTEKPIGKPGSELGKNLILLTMLQNHENKTLEMILSCSSESDRTRWLEAVTPRTSDNPEEKIYEEWDCPQVQAIHPYVATQPDELSLEVADVVNVLRKMADGWYQGERMRDDQRGWFPGNYTVEIASSHVRARNLRQRYRLLALSGNFIEEQARRDKEESKRKSKKISVISLNE